MGLMFRSDCRREGHTEDAVLDVGSSSLGPGEALSAWSVSVVGEVFELHYANMIYLD